ncbi:hypothetical protein EJB05_00817, partial [Eragrostis curvula]
MKGFIIAASALSKRHVYPLPWPKKRGAASLVVAVVQGAVPGRGEGCGGVFSGVRFIAVQQSGQRASLINAVSTLQFRSLNLPLDRMKRSCDSAGRPQSVLQFLSVPYKISGGMRASATGVTHGEYGSASRPPHKTSDFTAWPFGLLFVYT